MKYFSLLLFFYFYSFTVIGDDYFNLSFEATNNKVGELTGNIYNYFIFQDSYGFTWISSIEGLNRFDGHTIKQYTEEKGLKDRNIQSNFFEDNNGNIWFSTNNALNYYDRKSDCIIQLSILKEAGYKAFYLDRKNNKLWLGVSNKIIWINTNDTSDFSVLARESEGQSFSVITNYDGTVKTIIASPYFGNGIEIYNIEQDTLVCYDKYLEDYTNIIKSITLEKTLWLLVTKNELLLFNELKPTIVQTLKNLEGVSYKDVIKKNEEHIFIATKSDGLLYYDWKEEELVKKWGKEDKEKTLGSDNIKQLYLTNDQLWINIPNELGVQYAYLNKNTFENLFEQTPINSYDIKATSVVEDDRGNVWVGTARKGVYVFSSSGEPIEGLRIDAEKINSSGVFHMFKSTNGEIFIVTEKKIFEVNEATNSVTEVTQPENIDFRSMVNVFPNRILIITTKGIKELLKNEKNRYYIGDCKEFVDKEGFRFVQLFQSSKRKLYVPDGTTELWIYNATKNGLEDIKKVDFSAKLYGFFESKNYKDLIWVATENGLAKIENNNIEYAAVENSKFKYQSFYSVIEDDKGILWLTSNDGLWQYDPQEEIAYKYVTIDGLPNNSFEMYNGSILSSSGYIWLANNKGIVKFNPKDIKPNTILPKIHIDDMTVNFEEKCKKVNEHDKLKFQHNENSFSFKVDVIDYHRSEENIIHYRLDKKHSKWPFSNKRYEEWRTIKPSEQFNITGLSPCEYTLELKVEDGNGRFSDVFKKVIKINQPIYIWLLVIVSIISLFLLYRLLVQKQRAKNAELEVQIVELEQKALRAQMNPHFLLNTLSSIKALLFENKATAAATFFTKLSNLIDGVLDNSQKQLITLEKELEAIKLYMELEAFRFSNKFSFEINVANNVEESFVRVPPLILQPFVENSILHGFKGKARGEGKININVSRKGDFIFCEITDNGVGRAVKNTSIKSNGIGIQNTEKRIQLNHPKNRLNIIDLKDEKNKDIGTKVIIELYAPE